MYNNFQNYPNQFGYNGYSQYPQQQIQQNQFQQPYQQYGLQNDMLGGKIVDSIDVVKAINADLSGKANYYPKSDGSEIYCKRINPQTGASGIQTYILKQENDIGVITTEQQITVLINDLKQDIFGQIAELKNLVLDNITTPQQNRGVK